MAGIPTLGLMLLFVFSVIFLYLFRWWFMVPAIPVLYLIMRIMTAKDPWFIDIALDASQQKDIFIP